MTDDATEPSPPGYDILELIVGIYEGQPDDKVISVGHWVDDVVWGPPHKTFVAQLALTLADIRRAVTAKGGAA